MAGERSSVPGMRFPTFLRWLARGKCRARIMVRNPGERTYDARVCHRVRFHRGECRP